MSPLDPLQDWIDEQQPPATPEDPGMSPEDAGEWSLVAHHKRTIEENGHLKAENAALRAERDRLREQLNRAMAFITARDPKVLARIAEMEKLRSSPLTDTEEPHPARPSPWTEPADYINDEDLPADTEEPPAT